MPITVEDAYEWPSVSVYKQPVNIIGVWYAP